MTTRPTILTHAVKTEHCDPYKEVTYQMYEEVLIDTFGEAAHMYAVSQTFEEFHSQQFVDFILSEDWSTEAWEVEQLCAFFEADLTEQDGTMLIPFAGIREDQKKFNDLFNQYWGYYSFWFRAMSAKQEAQNQMEVFRNLHLTKYRVKKQRWEE